MLLLDWLLGHMSVTYLGINNKVWIVKVQQSPENRIYKLWNNFRIMFLTDYLFISCTCQNIP